MLASVKPQKASAHSTFATILRLAQALITHSRSKKNAKIEQKKIINATITELLSPMGFY